MRCELCFERDGRYTKATFFNGDFAGICVYIISCKPCIDRCMSMFWTKEFVSEEEFLIDKILNL